MKDCPDCEKGVAPMVSPFCYDPNEEDHGKGKCPTCNGTGRVPDSDDPDDDD